jgi:undecaprenyl-diphosphatase
MIVGFLLIKLDLIDILRNYKLIGWTTIIFAILLYISDLIKTNKTIQKDFNLKSALFVGLFQVLSLVPGVSRSGITITAGRFLNFNRADSAKISFLISIPTLAAVGIYNLKNIYSENNYEFSILNFFAIFLSFFFSYITIKYFLFYLKKFNLTIFVIYRIFLGIIILLFSY